MKWSLTNFLFGAVYLTVSIFFFFFYSSVQIIVYVTPIFLIILLLFIEQNQNPPWGFSTKKKQLLMAFFSCLILSSLFYYFAYKEFYEIAFEPRNLVDFEYSECRKFCFMSVFIMALISFITNKVVKDKK